MDLRIISIGALAANPLWGEREAARTGHATTTLIQAGPRIILVDPGLPEPALVARLGERANLQARDITHVFLTSFRPDVRRGIGAFEHATWWVSETERETVGVNMVQTLKRLAEQEAIGGEPGFPGAGENVKATLELDVAILKRCEPAPDRLTDKGLEQVDLFPLPGVTPGLTGLLIPGQRHTTLICGDAIPTAEHLEKGQVLSGAVDVKQARDSFAEAVEIADLLILGRDNMVVNPTKRPF
jgi:glyoxylase-like metal-dependent hydrolase (beta-lactamase superfamily II)